MKRVTLLFALALAALLWGCGETGGQDETYKVYFGTRTGEFGTSALAPEYRELKEDENPAEALVRYLLQGPEGEGFSRVIPQGTVLRGVRVENGLATVDFSARYGTLSGIELTLADYSVTMTLSQLPEVESVVTLVEGDPITYRDHERLQGEDVRLSIYRETPVKRQIVLYFPCQDGQGLEQEARTILLREDETLTTAALYALCQGPETEGALGVLTEAEVISVKVRDGVCYLNLAASFRDMASESAAQNRQVIEALVETLCHLDNNPEVRLLSEGDGMTRYGSVDLTEPLCGTLPTE